MFVKWWVGVKLPEVHYKDKTNFIKKFFFHPIKRRLAKYYLELLHKFGRIKVIAITGSAGKTTTKEMLASILRQDGLTVYTKENIDPVYNIPTTILRTPPWAKYLVLEMGVEYPGEMDFYLWLAKPDIGVVTNIFPTHTEFLGSIEGVFKEKSKLVFALTKNGIAVLNSGDEKLRTLSGKLKSKVIWFSSDDDPLKQNANAAGAVAKILGITSSEIKNGITTYQVPPHRLALISHKSGAKILDDSYNSNPWAAISTLHYFNKLAKGKKVAVLGDMLELGEFDEVAHRELGREVAKSDFEAIIGVGKSSIHLIAEVKAGSKGTKTHLVSNAMEAKEQLKNYLHENTYILVKGSRSLGLDKLIQALS